MLRLLLRHEKWVVPVGFCPAPVRACDGVHCHILTDDAHLGGGQQTELEAGSETAGVGNVPGVGDERPVDFGQAIDEVVAGCGETEVLCQVDDTHAVGHVMLGKEGFALAMAETEEEHVGLVEGHLVSEHQVGVAVESFVHVGDVVAGIALAVDECYLGFGVVDKEADEFACSVTGTAEYSYLDHGSGGI